MLKAVLFDAGDTLIRVRGTVGEVYARVAARHGVVVAASDMEWRFRAAFRQMPPLAFPNRPAADLPQCAFSWWKRLVATVFSDVRFADFDAFFRELFDYFADASAWTLFPDAQPALRELRRRGARLGLVSNFDGRLLAICRGLEIADSFDAIVTSVRAGFAKPDPRIFAVALRRLGVAPADAMHVGDSEREDVVGARAVGVHAVLVRRDAPPRPPDIVSDLRQLSTHRVA